MSYNEIYDYLRDKIVRTNVNNPKANWGARLLSEHMDIEDLDDHLIQTIDTIQLHFNTNNGSNPSGQANLSMLSMNIGKSVLADLDMPKLDKKPEMVDQVRTGDLFIEAFVKLGFLTLQPPRTSDESYVVKITLKWVELLKTSERNITNLLYTDIKPYLDGCRIKGEENRRTQDFAWRRSATKLMSTPWKINAPVLEALIANQSTFVSDVPIDITLTEDGTPDPYLELQEQRRASKLTDFFVVTSKASSLVGKEFYQEIEADYRGRLYYREPFMNFQGSDLARGIMLFGEGKVMTESGKWWLAVHTAASYNMSYGIDEIPEWCGTDYATYLKGQELDSISVDKFTLEDRVRWTNEYMETILHAGEHRLFADEAEKPVTFLACCIEWYGISSADGEYISHLPVGIDGSNNGWQHLGAISRDQRTGQLVGLVATQIPRDFYVQTAKQLLEIDDPKLNAMSMKDVRKAISKRGSMTRAYSAGADTIGKNMWFDVRSAEFDAKYDITEEDCQVWAKSLIKAINVVCPGPLDTMKYMQDLAVYQMGTYEKYRDGEPAGKEYRELQKELKELWDIKAADRTDGDCDRIEELLDESKEFESVLVHGNGATDIRWHTPSGFPVVYTAYREDKFRTKGTINGKRINHVLRIQTDFPDVHKFMCGISPNYVHSMDASHMANTIDKWDGTFGAIHDSFSTHASDVEDMLGLTKAEFVDMYTGHENFFEKIREDITRSTDDVALPQPGTLDIQEVYESDYFFA